MSCRLVFRPRYAAESRSIDACLWRFSGACLQGWNSDVLPHFAWGNALQDRRRIIIITKWAERTEAEDAHLTHACSSTAMTYHSWCALGRPGSRCSQFFIAVEQTRRVIKSISGFGICKHTEISLHICSVAICERLITLNDSMIAHQQQVLALPALPAAPQHSFSCVSLFHSQACD